MTTDIDDHLANLRASLLSLPATGANGFEGLVGVALAEIADAPFRLAASGLQFGLDGRSSYKGDGILFECKRYEDSVPRKEVLSKIAELGLDDDLEVEVWVLCATSGISTQLAGAARKAGENAGLHVLILDWSEIGLPPLAVALARGGKRVESFLSANVAGKSEAKVAVAALEAIRNESDYSGHASRLDAILKDASLALDKAHDVNSAWLSETFSERRRAFDRLGQPLSPGAPDTTKTLSRSVLEDRVKSFAGTVPDGSVLFVLGEEGVGKSWLVATSWTAMDKKPLMLFLTPDVFDKTEIRDDVDALLIEALIRQAGGSAPNALRKQWERRFRCWRLHPVEEFPRLIVVVDGLNQRPAVDWPRVIDRLNNVLGEIGGRLIVTTRAAHFRSRIKNRLISSRNQVAVASWAPAERDGLLADAGIDSKKLRKPVADALCNPRLLGIALELFQKAEIENMEELSVSRLLFEHMRLSERDAPTARTAGEFAAHLREHAQQVISRITSQQRDDLRVFEGGIEAVSDGRFFLPVEGEPNSYELSEDGLILALGFSVVSHLLTARRNHRDMNEALRAVTEPIAALDLTTNVILAALNIACVDDEYPQEIAAALVEAFAELQNPDESEFNVFRGLARTRISAFARAARNIWLSGARHSNADWIEGALLSFGASDPQWMEISDAVCEWLALHSLSPERHVAGVRAGQPEEKVKQDIEKRRLKIDESLGNLSAFEKTLLGAAKEDDGQLSTLARLAFAIIAGNPVAPFAKHLALWCFTTQLNSDLWAPFREAEHLIRLNRVDWKEARDALLRQSEDLQRPETSRIGQWARVTILRATGHPDDATAAEDLASELTKGEKPFLGWRLVEDYCATDPCDPESERPDNISASARKYEEIDAAELRADRSPASEDHFFAMARPGVIRFEQDICLRKHRELADNVLGREGHSLCQGFFELENHISMLGRDRALRFLEIGKRGNVLETLSEDRRWMVAQYPMLLAFPYLSGEEQVEAILEPSSDDNLLLKTLDNAKPLSGESFKGLLTKAVKANDERAQFFLLAFARFSGTPLSREAAELTGRLLSSDSKRVRTEALGLTALTDNEKLLQSFVETEWEGGSPEAQENSYEEWFGSLALLNACKHGLIPDDEILDRISPRLYGQAAVSLGLEAVTKITQRIDAAIQCLAKLEADTAVPDIELRLDRPRNIQPTQIELSEREVQTNDPFKSLRELSKGDDEFRRQQQRNYDAFKVFKEQLTNASARIILDSVELKEFEAIVASDPTVAVRWYDLFTGMTSPGLSNVCNFALMLGYVLAEQETGKAAKLFRRFQEIRPLVRYSFGAAGLSLDAVAIWASADEPAIEELRWERLDHAENDDELALEVLAALRYEKAHLLLKYIDARLELDEPAPIARALMVAGFVNRNRRTDELLTRYEDAVGFLGEACQAARYAYERNIWAQYWFESMCTAPDAEAFWRYSILLGKIVDGRIRTWHDDMAQRSETMEMFAATTDEAVTRRIKKWGEKRRKTLFGQAAPEPYLLRTV